MVKFRNSVGSAASPIICERWYHSKKKPGAEQKFKDALGEKLAALGLAAGSRVKVWMMDEAHFAHVPGVSLDWDEGYLRDLAATDAQAVHVLLRDQADFHLRDGAARLPARVRIIDLPPYSPELNPCEQLWDIVKDDIANRIYATVATLRAGMKATLRRFWDDPGSVLSLIGRDWLQVQLNASPKTQVSC